MDDLWELEAAAETSSLFHSDPMLSWVVSGSSSCTQAGLILKTWRAPQPLLQNHQPGDLTAAHRQHGADPSMVGSYLHVQVSFQFSHLYVQLETLSGNLCTDLPAAVLKWFKLIIVMKEPSDLQESCVGAEACSLTVLKKGNSFPRGIAPANVKSSCWSLDTVSGSPGMHAT